MGERSTTGTWTTRQKLAWDYLKVLALTLALEGIQQSTGYEKNSREWKYVIAVV